MLWILHREEDGRVVRGELVGLSDGVELELYRNAFLRRRWRFLRDAEARRYAARLRARLIERGFEQRRHART